MKTIINRLHDLVRTRRAYRRTVSELRSLPLDTALDLDINRDDVEAIARRATYGA